MNFCFMLIGTLFMTGLVDDFPESDLEVLNRAEVAFQSGIRARETSEEAKQFQVAAEYYGELGRRGIQNPDLYKNRGNACLLAGDWPKAILAYRRGLRLNPNDTQMRANLSYARDQVVYSSADNFARPHVGFWPPWLPQLTPSHTLW